MWQHGFSLLAFPVNAFKTPLVYCRTLLQNESFINKLRRKNFKVAIVDLPFNECSHALANHLGN